MLDAEEGRRLLYVETITGRRQRDRINLSDSSPAGRTDGINQLVPGVRVPSFEDAPQVIWGDRPGELFGVDASAPPDAGRRGCIGVVAEDRSIRFGATGSSPLEVVDDLTDRRVGV